MLKEAQRKGPSRMQRLDVLYRSEQPGCCCGMYTATERTFSTVWNVKGSITIRKNGERIVVQC